MELVQTALLLILVVALTAALSEGLGRKVAVPAPILYTLAGLGLSFVPGLGAIKLDPAVFFVLFIPPLLFSDAWLIPKRDFAQVIRPVMGLALGLVAFTVVIVGYVVHWLIPGIPLAAAFALGAIISPTDAVAVSSVTEKLKVPSRVTHILNGESLINDASGLVAFKFAVAAASTGVFSFWNMAGSFVVLALGGIVIGLAVAWTISKARLWIACMEWSSPSTQTALSMLTPFAAYLAAEHLHTSGILGVVAAGLYAGIHDTQNMDTDTRRTAWEAWSVLLFIFNGVVFVLLGLQLPGVFSALKGSSWHMLLLYAALVSGLVIVLRIVWTFPAAYLIARLDTTSWKAAFASRRPAHVFLVSWSGIRGSVTLAAALSIPLMLSNGSPFPGRDMIVFLSASVIVVTLVLQGMTLPLVIKWLKVGGDDLSLREEHLARVETARAAIERIRSALVPDTSALDQEYAARLIAEYEERVLMLDGEDAQRVTVTERNGADQRIRLAAISAERAELIRLRNGRKINEEAFRVVERDLDNGEAALRGAA
jgi:monovalent cation/hydrogen antiporter